MTPHRSIWENDYRSNHHPSRCVAKVTVVRHAIIDPKDRGSGLESAMKPQKSQRRPRSSWDFFDLRSPRNPLNDGRPILITAPIPMEKAKRNPSDDCLWRLHSEQGPYITEY